MDKQKHTQNLYTRVTPSEKEQILRRARKCGLSISEYIRQRCLGYAPREIPPGTLYDLCWKLDAIRTEENSGVVRALLDEVRRELILPGRDP